jgi:hypothetical protein
MVLIGASLAAWRRGQGLTRLELALQAQQVGLEWTERMVAETERGNRQLSLVEWILLPVLTGLDPTRFLGGEGWVHLTESVTADLTAVKKVLGGEADEVRPFGDFSTPASRSFFAEPGEDPGPVGTSSNNPDRRKVLEELVGDAARASPEESASRAAERKAADRLGVTPGELVEAAFDLWGKGLTDERDQRATKRTGGLDPTSARTVRGRITRELIVELAHHLGRATA